MIEEANEEGNISFIVDPTYTAGPYDFASVIFTYDNITESEMINKFS